MQADQQMERVRLQSQRQTEQFKAEQAQQIEMMKQQAETERERLKAEMDASTKIVIAQLQAQASKEAAEEASEVESESEAEDAGEQENPINALVQMHGELLQGVADVVQAMQKPKRRMLERGPDGRATGMIEIMEE